jgi:hypothetical protein
MSEQILPKNLADALDGRQDLVDAVQFDLVNWHYSLGIFVDG